MDFDRDLRAFLVSRGVLTPATIATLDKEFPRTRLEVVLLEKELVPRPDLLRIKSELCGFPPIDLKASPPPADVVRQIPGSMARKFACVAIEERAGALVVASVDPTDPFAQQWLGMRTQRQITFMVALYNDVLRVQNDIYAPDELDGMGQVKPQLPVIPKVTTEQRPTTQQRRVSLPLEGAPERAAPAAGRMLGRRYRLDRMSGQGGMGTVWRAYDVTLGDRPVALKVLRMEGFDPDQRPGVLAQFEHEARLLATLDHPGIVPVTDFFTESETPYLVMGWVEGRPLNSVLDAAGGPLPVHQVLAWGAEIADVLGYLHERKPPILFRDLKPDNVMLMENGRLRLVDFGLARPSDTRTATALRGIGTSGFSPPEQYGEGTSDTRTDIYSLGATLYNLLTATRPPPSISLLLGDLSLIRPRAINAEVPQWLDDLIVHLMSPRKDERPQSVREVREALETNRLV